MISLLKPTARLWLTLASLGLLWSCGGGGGANPATDPPRDPPSPPGASASGCGGERFPCAMSQVPREVLEHSDLLADEVMKMLDTGSTMATVVSFLRAQTGLADVASQGAALRFRLERGRDVFILPPVHASAPAAAAATAGAKPMAEHAGMPIDLGADGTQKVLAEGQAQKRALVLSPFKYSFAGHDDGAPVAQVLQATRGYAGNVVYLENATRTATTVGIQQFIGWEAFDVIHISSHGAQICDTTRCVSTIASGDSYSTADELLRITELGVNTTRVRGLNEKFVSLGPDFFKSHYPQGLSRKIIFFNACQTYGTAGSALSDVLLGTESVFLGWTDIVRSDAARAAALALFKNLSQNGVTVKAAADALGDLAFSRYTLDGQEVMATLLLDHAPQTELRLREVATLERPDAGGELAPNATVVADGNADDGLVDGVPYQILIEGIPKSQEDAAIVTFSVNGVSSTPQAVTIGERVGETGWRLRGKIPFIDVAPEQMVDMRAHVQLPEGGTSTHRVSVKLVSEPLASAETWVGEAEGHFDDITPQGEIHITRKATVTFKQSAASVGRRYKVLRVSGGTMSWTRTGTIKTLLDGYCAYSSGSVPMPIVPGDGEIIIDTAATPDAYSMSGSTTGVEVRVAQNCGNYAFSTRAGGAWAPPLAQSDGFVASPDGTLITGTATLNQNKWQWTFRRQ